MEIVGLFCGGFSSEFHISLESGKQILANFSLDGHEIYLVTVTRKGWTVDYKGEVLEVSPVDFSFNSKKEGKKKITLAQVYIHGNPGENGKLQAYFEMKGLPFVNSSALSSALSFDKWFCNQFLKNFGIKVADAVLLEEDSPVDIEAIGKQLGYPLFVKPSDSGSSYGISKVYKSEELPKAIEEAFKEGKTVVCESFMDGKEVTCGVYRNNSGIIPLPCTEIVTSSNFFDYEAKYMGKSQEITPARISKELTERVQSIAKRIYQLLQLSSLARVDFILIENEPHVIEVNTTPGFSKESIVPKMLAAAKISFGNFWREVYTYELNESKVKR